MSTSFLTVLIPIFSKLIDHLIEKAMKEAEERIETKKLEI